MKPTNGNSMKWYIIYRKHDCKMMAKVNGYDFAIILLENYRNTFKSNEFILTDKSLQHEKGANNKNIKPNGKGKNN